MLLDLYPQRAYAPSGMRRLMMYMLQEESLRKDEEKKRIGEAAKEAVEKVLETAAEPAPQPKPKKPRRKLPEVQLEPEDLELPKFRRKPTSVVQNAYDVLSELPSFVWLHQSIISIQTSLIINLEQERIKRRRQARRRAAAFLLMAA